MTHTDVAVVDVTRSLLKSYLFQDLSPAEVDALAARATVLVVRRGEHVFRVGDPADEIYVLATGQIREYTLDRDGNEYVSELFARGGVFGEPGAFAAERTRVVNEVAVTPSEVIRIGRDVLFRFLLDHPPALLRLLEGLANEARVAVEDVRRMAYADVLRRVGDRLLLLAETHGEPRADGSIRIALRLSQSELAAMVGCTRENANRALTSFTRQGLVRVVGRQIEVLDHRRLASAIERQDPVLLRRNRLVD